MSFLRFLSFFLFFLTVSSAPYYRLFFLTVVIVLVPVKSEEKQKKIRYKITECILFFSAQVSYTAEASEGLLVAH